VENLLSQLDPAGPGRIEFSTGELTEWDSSLLILIRRVIDESRQKGIAVDQEGLPAGIRRLLSLASRPAESSASRPQNQKKSFLQKVGDRASVRAGSAVDLLSFIGENSRAFLRLLVGKSAVKRSEFLQIIQESTSDAFPIVSLISLLVGLILAYVGSIQLRLFGAQIYVADLVGIGMVRAMGAIMTGIIMAGRTGASFAARIGAMQVNEEIDALTTTGIPPVDFLVLPRVIALGIAMPLLTLYSDFMGIVGGMIVGVFVLGLTPTEYYIETAHGIGLTNLGIGVFSGFVFGILVAVAACYRGMRCGRSASDVGDAVTSAVVSGIVSIVVATAVITVACDILGL
jgi:phospholipid/cholesterol/gamma-HCH transport system permease protein